MEGGSSIFASKFTSKVKFVRKLQIQLHNYRVGNQYRWHRDGIVGHNSVVKDLASPLHNLTRKLSMTVLLNDPSEFTGGEFKMKDHNIKDFEIKLYNNHFKNSSISHK